MPLKPTPSLQKEIGDLLYQWTKELWSGTGIDKDNQYTEPDKRNRALATKYGDKIGSAVEEYIEAIHFFVPIGTTTVGGPTTQATIAPFEVIKV